MSSWKKRQRKKKKKSLYVPCSENGLKLFEVVRNDNNSNGSMIWMMDVQKQTSVILVNHLCKINVVHLD